MAEWAAGPVGALCAGVCTSCMLLYVVYCVLRVVLLHFHMVQVCVCLYIYMGGEVGPDASSWSSLDPGCTIRGRISGRVYVGGVVLGLRDWDSGVRA